MRIWSLSQWFLVIRVSQVHAWVLVRGRHLSYFHGVSGFGDRSRHSVRSRDLIRVPNGVVRCGFGFLFVGFERILDFRTIRGVW